MKDIEKSRKINSIWKLSWILMWLFTGVVIAVMAFGMSITHSFSLSDSLKIGKVVDAPNTSRLIVAVGEDNQGELGYCTYNMIRVDFEGDSAKWKYLYLDITDMDTDKIKCKIIFRTANGEEVYNKYAELRKKMNKLTLTGQKFSCINIEIIEPQNCKLSFRNIQLREKEKLFPGKKDYAVCVLVFVTYIIGTVFLYLKTAKGKTQFYSCMDALQDVYIIVGNAYLWVPKKLSAVTRSRLRTILLMLWMIVMMTAGNLKKYWSGNHYKYNLVFCLCILFLITVLMVEKRLKRINWNRQIVFCWVLMSVLMCVSEFFCMKRFPVTGYINLLVFGFFYLVWNNMEEPKLFITEIMNALKGLFVFSVVFSLLFRSYIKENGCGYAGPTWNPNIFVMFLIPVLLVFLAEIIEAVQNGKKRKGIISIWGSGICISFIWLCGSRMGKVLFFLIILFFFVYIKREILKRGQLVRAILIVAVSVTMVVPIHAALEWGVIHLPSFIGYEIEFPADALKVSEEKGAFTVHAAEDTYWFDKVVYDARVTRLLAERNLFWMGYLREMNFLGHEYMPVFWGTLRLAHNGVLTFAYMYGVLIVVPYLFMYLNSVGLSFVMLVREKKNKGHLFFVFGVFVTAFFFMIEENIEQRPFLVTIWILFYLMLGYLFPHEKKYLDLNKEIK